MESTVGHVKVESVLEIREVLRGMLPMIAPLKLHYTLGDGQKP
jgi:hypothetical protein